MDLCNAILTFQAQLQFSTVLTGSYEDEDLAKQVQTSLKVNSSSSCPSCSSCLVYLFLAPGILNRLLFVMKNAPKIYKNLALGTINK